MRQPSDSEGRRLKGLTRSALASLALERVKVDLSRAFARGQAYVALSRATSLKSLQVIGFKPEKVLTHERVRPASFLNEVSLVVASLTYQHLRLSPQVKAWAANNITPV